MKVNINNIKDITILLLLKLKESKGNEVELNSDYYWDISNDEIYNPYDESKNISLGQLSDDLEEINRLQKNDNAIPYDLNRIANILKALNIENQLSF